MKTIGHGIDCSCRACVSHQRGDWLAAMAGKTASGKWDLFVTVSYRTPVYPWCRGFPVGDSKPSPEFAAHFFDFFICHLEAKLGEKIEFVVVDQYGQVDGRLHQHALLAGRGLDHYERREIESWLCKSAGYSRVLPFKKGAAFYVARFVGSDQGSANWRLRIGTDGTRPDAAPKRGKVTAFSAELPSGCFHQSLWNRHR